MLEILKKEKHKYMFYIFILILSIFLFKSEEVNAYTKPETITGTAKVILTDMDMGGRYTSETGGVSGAKFDVLMPDGRTYKGFCMDFGKYTPLDGNYSFTGKLRADGAYDIVINSNYIVMGLNQIHEKEKPFLAPTPIFPLNAQKIGWFKYEPPVPKGNLKLKKDIESNKRLIELCPENYTLNGAIYGVYKDEKAENKLGELKTDINGETNTLQLEAGRYFVKEIIAPKGFILDEKVYEVNVLGSETTLVKVKDVPKIEKLSFKIIKRASEDADKNLSLENAEYTLKYYKDTKLTKSNINEVKPFRTWIFKTNAKGEIVFNDSFKIGGDELFKDEKDNVVGLFGTYVVEEIKAPKGFVKTEGIVSLQNLVESTDINVNTQLKDVIHLEKPQTISIVLRKKDAQTGESTPQGYGSLAGAKYEVMLWDFISNKFQRVAEIITDENGVGVYENGKVGIYKIKEIEASKGYLIDTCEKEIKASIKELNKASFIYDVDSLEDITQLEFKKTSYNKYGQKINVVGAKIQLLKEGEIIEEFTTTNEAKIFKGLEVGATYRFKEVDVPDGYFLSDDIEVSIKDTKEVQRVNMFDAPKGKVMVSKEIELDKKADKSLLGNIDFTKIQFALFANEDIFLKNRKIYSKDDKIYEAFLDKYGKFQYSNLAKGRYYIKEMKTLTTLIKDNKKYEFEIRYDDNINIVKEFNIKNKGSKIKISKVDINSGKEVSGAKISIRDMNGEEVISFISKASPTLIEGLEVGKTYKLKEEIAPRGYVISMKEKEFKINEDGSIGSIIIFNKRISIEKKNRAGKLIGGANMLILDETGKVVDSFITVENTPYFPSNLKEGKKYILREKEAPKGYEKAEDIEFVVSSDNENQKVVMIDERKVVRRVNTVDLRNVHKNFALMIISVVMILILLKGKEHFKK